MSDLISRQALCEYALNQKDKVVTPNDIMRFPSADRPTGEWILMPMLPVNHRYKCSICKRHHRERYDYCPSCGARMLKEDGEKE